MDKILLTNVTCVHAAAQDCNQGVLIPPMYRVGDTVQVDREGRASIQIELHIVDEDAGHFEGRVVEAPDKDLCAGTEVIFECR